MSDEVKQAAERLRTIDDMQRNRNFPSPILQISDWQELARAFLAEHNPDTEKENATLLTAEILQASGLVSREDCLWKVREQGWELRVVCRGFVNVVAFGPTVEFDQYNQIDIGHLETVGDLRKLLDALHVPAVITVPKRGE